MKLMQDDIVANTHGETKPQDEAYVIGADLKLSCHSLCYLLVFSFVPRVGQCCPEYA